MSEPKWLELARADLGQLNVFPALKGEVSARKEDEVAGSGSNQNRKKV